MIGRRCPNDGRMIPQVGQHRDWPQPLVRFYWCRPCEELFAFVGENEFGGRFAVSFTPDRESGGWWVEKVADSERDVQLASQTFTAWSSPAETRRRPSALKTAHS